MVIFPHILYLKYKADLTDPTGMKRIILYNKTFVVEVIY